MSARFRALPVAVFCLLLGQALPGAGHLSAARLRSMHGPSAARPQTATGASQVDASAPRAAGGAFVTGRYRNLFREAGHSDEDIRKKIDAAFRQLFHGDPDTQAVFYWAGENGDGGLAYLSDINNRDVRSEGMSYGMMIAVQLDKKTEFDALWNWSRTFMHHESPAHPAYGFFSWSMKTDGTPNSESPAPDGEEYYTMALYFASARWGDGKGIYNYRATADRLLSDMKNRGVITGPWTSRADRIETDGAEFNLEHRMVRFTPDNRRPDHTDPSYHLPAFYELWARWGPAADRPFWAEAARVSRDFLQKTTHPVTGLAPEYADFDCAPVTNSRNQRSSTFGPDAWRTAANWSVDWSWWAADPRERGLSDRIQAFFESKGLDTYGKRLLMNRNGRMCSFDLAARTLSDIDTGSMTRNNNDHALSFDWKMLGLSGGQPTVAAYVYGGQGSMNVKLVRTRPDTTGSRVALGPWLRYAASRSPAVSNSLCLGRPVLGASGPGPSDKGHSVNSPRRTPLMLSSTVSIVIFCSRGTVSMVTGARLLTFDAHFQQVTGLDAVLLD